MKMTHANASSGWRRHGSIRTGRSDRRSIWLTALLIGALGAAVVRDASAETWTDGTGKYTVEAEFITLRGTDVYLKKANGVVIKVPLNLLSVQSQQLARQLATPAPSADSPDGAARTVFEGLQTGDLRVVWDALPPSYQRDVNDVVHTFADNMDAELWNDGVGLAKKVVLILQQKKEFILGYPRLANLPIDRDAVSKNWDAAAEVLDAIVNSELTDLEKLKAIDVGAFLDGSGKAIGQKIAAVAESIADQELPGGNFPGVPVPVDAEKLGKLRDAKISTVKSEGDTATIRIEADGEVKEEELVRVEGKWLPKEMVDQWSDGIAKAKQEISTTMVQSLQENKDQLKMPMMMFNGLLTQVLQTKTQEEFNQMIDGMIKSFKPEEGGGPAEGPGGDVEGGGLQIESPAGGADPFGN